MVRVRDENIEDLREILILIYSRRLFYEFSKTFLMMFGVEVRLRRIFLRTVHGRWYTAGGGIDGQHLVLFFFSLHVNSE